MKTKIYVPVLLVCFFLIGTACKKTKLEGKYEKYEGVWQSITTELTLKENGRGSYNKSDGASTISIGNGRLIIENDKLIIKDLIDVEFDIDLEPTLTNVGYGETYYMILDGEEFYRD